MFVVVCDKLQSGHAGVFAIESNQFSMRARFDDPSELQDVDPVGMSNRANPAGDQDCRSTTTCGFNGFLNFMLGFGVDSRRGVVQDQNRRIEQQARAIASR